MCPAHATAKGLCSRAWRSVSTSPAAPGEGAGGARAAGVPGGPAAGGEVPAGAPGGARDPWLRCAFPECFSSPLRASPTLSLICCRWDVGAGVTRRGPGCRSCPGSAAPRRHRAEIPAPPHRGSIAARVSPFPRCPCPAPCSPAGVMLGRSRASPGGLRYPRVNPARLGAGGLRGPGTRVGFVFGNLFPPVSSPSGLFLPKGDLGFFINIFQPSQSSSEGSA